MLNYSGSRRTITDLSKEQQIRELNRQLDWLWRQMLELKKAIAEGSASDSEEDDE